LEEYLLGPASNPPGFLIYEKAEDLDTHLMLLPPWLESIRNELEGVLPPVHLHKRRKEEQHLLSKNRNKPIIMEIKPKMEKKSKLSFIYRFMPPKK
jgi:hypothetical protein